MCICCWICYQSVAFFDVHLLLDMLSVGSVFYVHLLLDMLSVGNFLHVHLLLDILSVGSVFLCAFAVGYAISQ